VVANSYEVDKEGSATHHDWQQERTQQHLLDPQLTLFHNTQNYITAQLLSTSFYDESFTTTLYCRLSQNKSISKNSAANGKNKEPNQTTSRLVPYAGNYDRAV